MAQDLAPAVSVLIVNWNRLSLLQSCLQSLASQTFSDFEIIVVDNGSIDGSADWIETSREARRFPFPIRLIRNSENKGFCAANNQAIAVARGPYVALLNNDAEAKPEWLEALLTAFQQQEIGMAASKILVWEEPGRIDKAGHLIYPDGQNRGRGSGQLDQGQFDETEEVLWPDGCAAMYRKSMLDQIGGFDEDLFAYADDAELGLRARIAGWRCLYVPSAVVLHHRGTTLGLLSSKRLKLIERNRVLLAVKLFPLSLLLWNPWYFAKRLVGGIVAALRGRGEIGRFGTVEQKVRAALAVVEGDLAAIPLIPKMWAKRSEIDQMRALSHREVREMILRDAISVRELSEQAIPGRRT